MLVIPNISADVLFGRKGMNIVCDYLRNL